MELEFSKEEILHSLRMYFCQIGQEYPENVYERFAKFIQNENIYYRRKLRQRKKEGYYSEMTGQFTLYDFYSRIDTLYNLLELQGYNEEEIHKSMATLPVVYRRGYFSRIPIYEALGIKDKVLIEAPRLLTIPIELLHARKMYMLENGIQDEQNKILLADKHNIFQRRCNTDIAKEELLERYPLSDETKYIFYWMKGKSDEELMRLFKMPRKEIFNHYPTTKDELESIQIVGFYSDRQLYHKYGMNKEQLFRQYPLNHEVLNTIASVHELEREQVKTSDYCKVKQ